MTQTAADRFRSRHLHEVKVRDLPDAPRSHWRIIGPGIIAAGVGLASGEFILFPYIASQVGLVFVWAALVGLVTQYFLNMEIERYTLATGETALTGFSRYWRHWGLVFAILTYFANLWPGWATSSATLRRTSSAASTDWIAIGMLVVIGLILTLAPVVYVALERAQMLKVAAVVLLFVVARDLRDRRRRPGRDAAADRRPSRGFPTELGFALLLGALAFAGAGGGQNLVQSNWIRDKGFGMGTYVPRLVSPITGQPEAAPSTGYVFEPTDGQPAALARLVAVRQHRAAHHLRADHLRDDPVHLAAGLLHRLRREGLANSIGFLETEGEVLGDRVGSWFQYFFWIIGAFSLFAAALGIVDYTSRLAADVLKTSLLPGRQREQDLRRAGLGPGPDRHRGAARPASASRSCCWSSRPWSAAS